MLLQPLKYLIVVMGQMKQIFGCLVLFKASRMNKRILDMKIMLMVIIDVRCVDGNHAGFMVY